MTRELFNVLWSSTEGGAVKIYPVGAIVFVLAV